MATCQYWNCGIVIKENHFLCFDHYNDYREKHLDQCPKCKKFKGIKYDLCLPCARASESDPISNPKIEHERSWEKKDRTASEWFVYVLKLEEPGRFYIGQTRDLEERMLEHKEGMTSTTKGLNPKLYFFERHASRASAERREAELKQLNEKDRREIRGLITRFQNLLEWVPRLDEIRLPR